MWRTLRDFFLNLSTNKLSNMQWHHVHSISVSQNWKNRSTNDKKTNLSNEQHEPWIVNWKFEGKHFHNPTFSPLDRAVTIHSTKWKFQTTSVMYYCLNRLLKTYAPAHLLTISRAASQYLLVKISETIPVRRRNNQCVLYIVHIPSLKLNFIYRLYSFVLFIYATHGTICS